MFIFSLAHHLKTHFHDRTCKLRGRATCVRNMISVSGGHLLLILVTQTRSDPGVFLVETKDVGLAGKLLKKSNGSALKTSCLPKNQ
jgi:hypothetical protein